MATRTNEGKSKSAGRGRKRAAGPGKQEMLRLYRTMYSARRTDDREIQLKRQNKIFFQISGAGHEALQVAMAAHLRPGSDWAYLYYRDRALSQALGVTPYDQLLEAVGAASDPASGGRQMPSHWGSRPLRIVSTSSPTGTQFLQSAGMAEGGCTLIDGLREKLEDFEDDEVVVCTTGEGQTSEGEFWEALNTACNLKLPVVFVVEDNEYAISVPVEVGTAGGSISKLVSGFPDLLVQEVDGCDVLESWKAAKKAVEHARKRKGPALIHGHVIRPYSHSMSDDERAYKSEAQREEEAKRDPIPNFRQHLLDEGVATEEELDALEQEVRDAIQDATDRALEESQPAPETVMDFLYSPDADPTSSDFDTEDSPAFEGDEGTTVDLLNACLRDEMER
ncbi:MAG: thiamine pyrophosphate-dependent dehydrogenase E1 component subunit alpha, partial [Gemmatimonadota bacterium]